jgi:hypothetical protein
MTVCTFATEVPGSDLATCKIHRCNVQILIFVRNQSITICGITKISVLFKNHFNQNPNILFMRIFILLDLSSQQY